VTTIVLGALLIGVTLGLLGSGGSTLTVPVLVYLVGHNAKVSIAESMAIVGIISLIAAIPYTTNKQVDWRSVWFFGVPGMIGTYAGAWLGGLAPDTVQLIVFAAVLLLAAAAMFYNAFHKSAKRDKEGRRAEDEHVDVERKGDRLSQSQKFKIVCEGLIVGVLTGFVGVGGGFLIVPALVVFGKLPMRLAIGTSLVIVTFKSAVGFAKYQHILIEQGLSVDWQTIAIFGLLGIFGSMLGRQLNQQMNQRSLQQAFAVFLVLIGCFILIRESTNTVVGSSEPVVCAHRHLPNELTFQKETEFK